MAFLYAIISIFAIAFQGLLLFFTINLMLSLWNVTPYIAFGLASAFIIFEILFGADILSLFFLPLPDEECGIKDEMKKLEKKAGDILAPLGISNLRILVFSDTVPMAAGFGSITGKKFLALSFGFFNSLTDEEAESLILRQGSFIKSFDLGIFTAAAFVPFALYTAAGWLYESARFSRRHKGSGAANLAANLVMYIFRAAEFILLFAARSKQKNADIAAIKSGASKDALASGMEKLMENFVKPPLSGVAFRKRVYEGMRPFLPFDTLYAINLKIWQSFLENAQKCSLLKVAGRLENENYFVKSASLLSSHPKFTSRFPIPESEEWGDTLSALSVSSKKNFYINQAPLIFFITGIIILFLLRIFLGLPLILAGLGIIIRLLYNRAQEKKSSDTAAPNSPVNLSGTLKSFRVDDEIDAPYFFIKTPGRTCALIMRQMVRDEDALFALEEQETEITGTIKVYEIPIIDIKTIKQKGEKNEIKSGYSIFQIIIATMLFIAGTLMFIIQYPL